MKWQASGPVPRKFEIEVDGIKLESRVITGLLSQYRLFHDKNGMRLPTDWEERVWAALATAYPGHVRRSPGGAQRRYVSIGSALNFIRFMTKRLSNRSLVAPEEARRRAAICGPCRLSRRVSGCSVCKDALSLTVTPPEAVAAPEACLACGCYMPLKIWIPREQLGSADEYPFDESCWMREPQPSSDSGGTIVS